MGVRRGLFRCVLATVVLATGCANAAVPTPAPTATETPVALALPGAVLYFPFDGDARDHSPNHTDGQVHGAVLTSDRFGRPDGAYYFDGLDDAISFEGAHLPTRDTPRTISAWIQVQSLPPELWPGLGSRATVVGWGAQDWNQLSEMQLVNGCLQFHCYDRSAADVTASVALDLNAWHHLAIVYADGVAVLYVDGVQDRSGPATLETAPGPGMIGAWPGSVTATGEPSHYHGSIDEVSIFDRALSPAQIRALYTEGSGANAVSRAAITE